MKKSPFFILFTAVLSCSPYKKVVVTKSDQLTSHWKGQTEQMVQNSLGRYKSRTSLPDGFLICYDYSYVLPAQMRKSGNFQVTAAQQSNIMTPPANRLDHPATDDSVIRRMDFYFDKNQRVQYVQATGFPDSVYRVKRK